ncbi:MAG: hypothetical protein AAFO94_20520, partial [Bacteroidota bacterium]
ATDQIMHKKIPMRVVSSSMTVVLKFFLPSIWITLFSTLTIAAFISKESMLAGMPASTFRIWITVFLLLGIALLYWAVMSLKRVEMDGQYFYTTNYRQRLRYTYESIERIIERDWLLFKTVHIFLKEPGRFGKKISFVASGKRFNKFLQEHPQVAQRLLTAAGK